ncbi:hypothetical protein HUW62_01325 [Myxococcus sp. AM011]|uniref:SMI1/KNR4 family protein n=1 Tax=Myxococcus sp. AM011 TaxID=2745200 RepID=UPI0015956AD6|nr:SMI1/KNR4 family protein [Myxococcus sp. AM011]NVJ19877.1 hypothetical protein [Myxococcus sp. AM011]
MDELLTLLERYAPGYRDHIEGYPGPLLDELEEAFGRALPSSYRQFAELLGARGGALLSTVEAYDPLLDVADFYRVMPMEMPPRRFLYLFGDSSPLTPMPYWLDLEAPFEDGDCQVVRMPLGEHAWKTKLSRDYVGLRELLFLWAMENIHLPSFPHQARYQRGRGQQPTTAEKVAQLLGQMGFTRLPYPRHSMLFERDDAALRLYRPPESPHFEIRVGMRSSDKLAHFQAVLEDNTDLEKSLWNAP